MSWKNWVSFKIAIALLLTQAIALFLPYSENAERTTKVENNHHRARGKFDKFLADVQLVDK